MSFTYDGKDYQSKTACAVALVGAGMSVKVAAATVGIAYQTVYVNTVGKEKRVKQLAKRQAKKLAMSKRNYSKKEISRRTGLGEKAVRNIFKKIVGNTPAVVADVPAVTEPVIA